MPLKILVTKIWHLQLTSTESSYQYKTTRGSDDLGEGILVFGSPINISRSRKRKRDKNKLHIEV